MWRDAYPEDDAEIEMADGGVFEVADVRLEVIHAPGHTPGSVCLYCEDLDAVFTGHTLTADGPVPHDGEYPDFASQLTAIGEYLLTLPGSTRVLPGEGEETTIAAAEKKFDAWVSADRVRGLVEQLGFEGMPRRLYPCTPTRLSAWLDCPRRYRMSYLDRPPPPKGPPWAHNSLGASIHNALAGWWRLPLAERTVAAAGRLVDRGWIDEGFADETQSVRCREHAIEMVQGYVAHLDPADEPLGVERTVATRTDTIAFSGRIDRLDARPAEDSVGLGHRGHRAGRGRLQDRAAPAHRGRRARLDGPGPVRAGRQPGPPAPLPPGRAAPPAVRAGGGLVAL